MQGILLPESDWGLAAKSGYMAAEALARYDCPAYPGPPLPPEDAWNLLAAVEFETTMIRAPVAVRSQRAIVLASATRFRGGPRVP